MTDKQQEIGLLRPLPVVTLRQERSSQETSVLCLPVLPVLCNAKFLCVRGHSVKEGTHQCFEVPSFSHRSLGHPCHV